jgi:hypothetical protein
MAGSTSLLFDRADGDPPQPESMAMTSAAVRRLMIHI